MNASAGNPSPLPPANETDSTPEVNPPVTFSYHWYVKAVAVVCILMFLGCSLLTIFRVWGEGDLLPVVVFPGLTLLGVVLLLWASRSYTVGVDGVLFRSWYRPEEMHIWAEMETVEGTGFGSGIRILDSLGRNVLSLDPWIAGYAYCVELLRRHKPELFDAKGRTFKRNAIMVPFGILLALFFLAPSIRAFLEKDPLTGGVLFLFSLLIVLLILRIPLTLDIRGDQLALKYIFGERRVHAEEVRVIYARSVVDVQGGSGASAIVELKNGRKIELTGYKEGTPVVVNALANWLLEFHASQEEKEEEEAIRGE